MKKNGFTLVELLAVIIILSVVSVMAIPRLITSIKSNSEDNYDGIIQNIILAANSYANNNGGILVQIPISLLQEEGYLPYTITNPIDNQYMDGCVYVVDGVAIYKEESCSTYLKGIEPNRMVSATCEYAAGDIWTFDYLGEMEEWTVPCDGTYKLEVWGAEGAKADGMVDYDGGKGGYAAGNINTTKGTKLYVGVGGRGTDCKDSTSGCENGGFNGGGNSKAYSSGNAAAGGGGGATHIGTFNETLATHGNKEGLYIVAGGGGGGNYTNGSNCGSGGAGGGLTGGEASNLCKDNLTNTSRIPGPGTQLAGGCATNGGSCGSFGQGANLVTGGSGGGGGLYGGSGSQIGPGAGGSSYVGGVTDGETISGESAMPTYDGTSTMTGNTGDGYAKITFVSSPGGTVPTHDYSVGSTWDFPFNGEFNYEGTVQEFVIPEKGKYKLEVWGAQGGAASSISGGAGGYASGLKRFDKDTKLSIVVGGAGSTYQGKNGTASGGFNGGGLAQIVYKSTLTCGSGGGATHIALYSNSYDVLSSYGNATTAANYVYLVAGGGGGAAYHSSGNNGVGGYGGGLTGGNGGSKNSKYGTGGTQEAGGYFFNELSTSTGVGTFGQGASTEPDGSEYYGGAGGGGFYGGGSSSTSYTNGGGGGSGYIGDVSNASLIAGNAVMPSHEGVGGTMTGNTGNGYARITLISY